MGLEDLIAQKRNQAKFQKKVIKLSDLDKIAAEQEKMKEEEKTSRLGTTSEKNSWITRKKDEAADWYSGPSEDEEEYLKSTEPPKVVEVEHHVSEHKISEEAPSSAPAWGSQSAPAPAPKIVNEKMSAEPGAFVPSALKQSTGIRPKLEDAMEFPSLEVAALEETVKPKIETENDSNWKTVGRSDNDYNSRDGGASGGYRNRNYGEDFGGERSNRRRDRDPPMEASDDWSRGNVLSRGSGGGGGGGYGNAPDSAPRRNFTRSADADGPIEFTRGSVITSTDSRPPPSRAYRAPTSSSSDGWSRGNVIDRKNNSETPTSFELQQDAKAREIQMQHKNRFEALSELN